MIDVVVYRKLIESVKEIGLHLNQDEVDQIVLIIQSACIRLLSELGTEAFEDD